MHGKSDPAAPRTSDPPGPAARLDAPGEPGLADSAEMAAVRAIVEGTARGSGEVFFQSPVRGLAAAVGVEFAFVAEFAGAPARVRTLAYWGYGPTLPNLEYDLAGTPCEDVV